MPSYHFVGYDERFHTSWFGRTAGYWDKWWTRTLYTTTTLGYYVFFTSSEATFAASSVSYCIGAQLTSRFCTQRRREQRSHAESKVFELTAFCFTFVTRWFTTSWS